MPDGRSYSCAVLAVGSELLLGQVVDTNSAWIGEQLAVAGIDCHYQAKVGDNQVRIAAAIQHALARSDAVICCGGLGPTQDDVTREAIADVLGVALELDEDIATRIEAMFSSRGRSMALNNIRQAEVPAGAEAIAQTRGTAPGLICRLGDRSIYAVPGVPHEMRDMVARAVIPDLVAQSGAEATILSRTLRTWGLTESTLAERLAPRLDALDAAARNGGVAVPTIAFLASGAEGIKVRITAKASTAAQARAAIGEEEAAIRGLLGPVVFGVDEETIESVVGSLLREAGLTLGLAESVTGGLVASRITNVPGSSEWFRGSLVAYATEVKRSLLGVDASAVVSESAALQMAEGAAKVLGADVGLALTGVAGPAEQEGKPAGTVWVGLAGAGPAAHLAAAGSGPAAHLGAAAHLLHLPGDRDQVRQLACISALDLLRRRLAGL